MSKKTALWLLPLLFFLLITPWISTLDLTITRWIYAAGDGKGSGFYSNALLDFFYKYGLLPAQATCGITGLLFLFSYKYEKLKAYRKVALALSLSMFIGSGIIAHVLLKECWGRPRPKQMEEFGGKQQFRPYYLPNPHQPEPSKSFPSGHATCGFYFFIFYFVGKRTKNRTMQYGGLFLSIFLGILLSATRMVQGGHFLSDIIAAALLMWESAILSDWLVFDYAPLTRKLET
jgi:lipid A 4'-phosphatase